MTDPDRDRTILHVDMDAFYASIEQRRRPELRGTPVIVGARGRRGVVAAASYEARAYGVHSAMPSMRAERLCPHATFVSGDHAHYAEVSGRIMETLRTFTPLVEPLSLDEAFLDVTGARRLHGDGPTIAAAIRARILEREQLTCSVGVAPTKFLAKLATEESKPTASRTGPVPGRGVTVVRRGDELAFLRPLPVEALWGVGPKTLAKLHQIGIRTVHDLERMDLGVLARSIGDAHARHLHDLAHARDDRAVEPHQQAKSISHEETFRDDIDDRRVLQRELVRLADAVAARVRAQGKAARTVSIKVRFGDFTTISRSATTPVPTNASVAIARTAGELLDRLDVTPGVRLLGVGLSNLTDPAPEQLRLDALDAESVARPNPQLDRVIDAVRARFGDDAVVPATLAGNGRLRPKRQGDQQWGPDAAEHDGANAAGRVDDDRGEVDRVGDDPAG